MKTSALTLLSFLIVTLVQAQVSIERYITKTSEGYSVKEVIKKGAASGFAKYNVDLGGDAETQVTVTGDGKSSTKYDAANSILKFIWVGMQATETTITLTYTIKGITNFNAAYPGDFAYVENNEKKIVSIKAEDCHLGN